MQQKRYIGRGELGISLVILVMLLLLYTVVISEATPSIITPSPIIVSSSVSPTKVQPGDMMTVTAVVFDFYGVEKVEAKFFHEQGFDIVNLSRVIGSNHLGVWEGQWMVHDTKIKEYTTQVTAFSKSGLSSSKDLTWDDPVSWWENHLDWSYRKLITLSSSQILSDQTNFPVLINITDTDLCDDAQSDGDDIAFTDSSGNQLNHEIEIYTSGTGKLIAWVNVTSLSSSSDTEIYMYYGNSGCTTQQNVAGTWDGGYVGVWHFNDGNGASSFLDSTGNNNNGSAAGADIPTWTTSGKVGGAYTFDGNDRVGTGITTAFTDFSVNIFFKDDGTANSYERLADKSYTGGFWFGRDGTTETWGGGVREGSPPHGVFVSIPVGGWRQAASIRDGTTHYVYGEGDTVTSNIVTGDALDFTEFAIGAYGSGSASQRFSGTLDECRLSNVARNASWINTVYNNINNATDGSFYTLGTEEVAIPTAPTAPTPSNNGYTNDITPTFQWTVGDNAVNNTFVLYNDSYLTGGDEHINTTLNGSESSYTITNHSKNLTEIRWYWKVIANNSQGSNSSDVWSFTVDTIDPSTTNLSSPVNDTGTDSTSVTFRWNETNDNAGGSGIDHYQLQVASDQSFSEPLIVDDNSTTNNYTTKTIPEANAGRLYWQVRAWDQAGNNGSWSETGTLIVFSYTLSSSTTTLQIKKGTSGTSTINVSLSIGVAENVSLNSSWSGDNTPSGITVSYSTEEAPVSFDSVVTIDCGGSATTGSYTCVINGTSVSGINRSVSIDITVYSMLFSLDVFPRSLSMIRSDTDTATASIVFDQGALNAVTLSGTWIGSTPSGVSVGYSPSSGTPDFDSTVTFSTSSTATAGSFVYRITATSAGLSKIANIYLDISKNISLAITTDKESYEKGQEIQISGTAKDPDGNSVGSGTATIQLSATNWSHSFTTSITSGTYSTSYYIAFDKPGGDWTVSVTATDSHGHETSSSVSTSISVGAPEIYEHYYIDILSPTAGQLFKRGETVTFSISLYDSDDEKIQGADVKACFSSGEEVVFSEGSAGMYSVSYDLGYDFPVGSLSVYVEGKNLEDGKLKVGFNYIDFKVKSISPVLELIEPKAGALIEVGETIKIKIKALYPDGTPLEESVITAVGPDGEELLFIRSKEPGIYVASYTLSADDFGDWAIQIKLEDAYGNSVVLEGVNVEIVHSRVMSILLRYWWATLAGVIAIAALASYLIHRKLRKIKLFNLKNEILELGKLKKRNAILYFSEGEITRETYDKLSQDYESKIARLSKKQRLLEKKIEKKKNLKKEGGSK